LSGDVYDIAIEVTKKPCAIETCPIGQIQDLYMCGCNDLQPAIGELFDFSVANTLFTARKDVGGQFTLREWAPEAGFYGLTPPEISTLDCVTSTEVFADEWGRYRQYSFTAAIADCRYDLVQYSVDTAGVIDTTPSQKFQAVVWPAVNPEAMGTLADLDAGIR